MNMHVARLILLLLVPALVSVLSGCAAAVVAGAGTAVLVHEDRRTVGTITEDEGIELKASGRIRDKYQGCAFQRYEFQPHGSCHR